METTIAADFKKQATYLLPIDVIRAVKHAAAERDIYPANVVEEAVREFLARRTARKRVAVTSCAG